MGRLVPQGEPEGLAQLGGRPKMGGRSAASEAEGFTS